MLDVLYAPPTPICCQLLWSTQALLPACFSVAAPQSGTHSLLAFALVHHHTHSTVSLKSTVTYLLNRPNLDRFMQRF